MAQLKLGTLIGGNVAWHAGNDGVNSGLDSDLLDGQQGTYYLDWTNATNKPSPVITLAGDLSGSLTLTGLSSGTLTATIQPNSVELGSDTTGNYIASATAGTGIVVSGSGTESAAVTISHADTSSIENVSSSARTFVNSLTFDTFGHVTGFTTETESAAKTIYIEQPDINETIPFFYTSSQIMIDRIVALTSGVGAVSSAGADISFTIKYGSTISSGGTEIIVGGIHTTNDTTGDVITSFDNAIVPANNYIWIYTNDVNIATTSWLNVTVEFL